MFWTSCVNGRGSTAEAVVSPGMRRYKSVGGKRELAWSANTLSDGRRRGNLGEGGHGKDSN